MQRFLFVLALLFIHSNSFTQTVLKYELNEGDSFTLVQNASQTITQDIPGAKQVLTNEINSTMALDVITSTEEMMTLEMRYLSFNWNMTSPQLGNLMTINTETNEGEEIQLNIFKSLLDTPLIIKMSSTGKLIKMEGVDVLLQRMADNSGLEDEAANQLMIDQLSKEWGPEQMSASMEQMLYNYSDQKVAVNDTWTTSFDGKLEAETTWKLAEQDTTVNTITGNASVSMNEQNAQVTMKLSGNQNTVLTTNAQTGMISEMVVTQTMSGDTVVPQLPDTTIPTTMESKITYTVQ